MFTQLMCFRSLRTTIVAGLVVVSAWAQAAVTVYTDRTTFQNAMSSFTVDGLDDVAQGINATYVRADYTIQTVSGFGMYGCWNVGDCGDNTSIGFNFRYLWDYLGPETFTFTTAVHGLGFDYGNPVCCSSGAKPIINGESPSTDHGFFGIISDVALTTYTVDQSREGAYMLIDNVTYGAAAVPEPETYALMLAGLGVLGFVARRRNQS